ncbi:MAG: response regulator, partial [Proteobacteria bacterium]|nr:response regulator [Pseudomonadota bacterium]
IIREKAATRRIRLTMDAALELGTIEADARKLKQIVYNLLSNAVKFTDGGRVTLAAARVARADVGKLEGPWPGRSLPLVASGFAEFLEIRVTDSGIGISEEGMEQLFRPFSQIDSGLARKFEGTGLGLAMVKLLAELHGGTVAVESAVGDGSRFTVWLPFRGSHAEVPIVARPTEAPLAQASSTNTALMVEDDPRSAELIRIQLEAEGFRVLHASSAEEALRLAQQEPLALITLDIMLPDMDGWELLARIKQHPALARTPVVIISIVADQTRGFALGAAAVLQKPFSRKELYDAVADLGLFPIAHDRSLKILVVDDEPQAVELMAVRLDGLASSIFRAYGGREAIELARRELPDLIVLDLMMPEVNGFEVVEVLHQDPDTSRIPILVVTAKQVTAADISALNGYVSAIMDKTAFSPKRFLEEVRRASARRHVVA